MKSALIILFLVVLGVAARLAFVAIPNFAPVASLALFAGYVLSDQKWALAVPFCVMAITDQFLGGYQGLLMATVYIALAAPVFWGKWASTRWSIQGSSPVKTIGNVVRLVSCVSASSVVFFVSTNFVTWCVTPWYEKTLPGFWLCFARGLEFFRYTLAGDIVFAFALFGTYATVMIAVAAVAPTTPQVREAR
ncbi:MAG: hypothetical protein O2931_17820 [Planctomycetota bacterium]|nr:hypothetical protein [Planctomycetota bacterium]MDA1180639.1 hypothetical protein [Planctomycetota bacterium]